MSVSRSVGTLVKRGFVEEVSSEVYRATLKGKEYAEAYSDIRGGGTRKTVQA
jgi:predicted transcriptional regulator